MRDPDALLAGTKLTREVVVAQRRFLIALLAVGSTTAFISCGSTDESSVQGGSSASVLGRPLGGPDGGSDDWGLHFGRLLLVRGGEVTFVGVARAPRCTSTDGDAGACPDQQRFFGSVIIRGAHLTVLRGLGGAGDDGGVAGAPGGDDGGVSPPRNALLFVEGSSLVLSGPGSSGDGGVVTGGGDAGANPPGSSALLSGGRIFALLGRAQDGDGGVPGAPGGDGGVLADGGVPFPSAFLRVGAVRIEQATIHFRRLPGDDADAGARP